MSVVYGEHSMSRARVLAWHERFREGRVSLQDDARPGQAHRVITPDVIAALGGHIRANRRITVEEISLLMGTSPGSVHDIVTNTCCTAKSARSGFHINSRRNRRLREWLHHWVTCNDTMRKSTLFCPVLPLGTKLGATILNPRANGRSISGNT